MTGGKDTDGDGKIEARERTKESAEWVNALVSSVWAIINPDL
jgi:Ca2+-dependent lipid-binding protein